MSTVKIKTEPAAAAAATAVDVKVKLEPSLSTADIKLEQHSSDIDTKVESDSDAGSEEDDEDNIKSESDEGSNQHQATEAPQHQRPFICKHPGCGRSFTHIKYLRMHQHEHTLQAKLNVLGKTYTLTRQSSNDRWSCPVTDCTSKVKTVHSLCNHMRIIHSNTVKQQQQLQQLPFQKTWNKLYFHGVDNFYVNNVRCGYHNTTGLLICHECRLVPEYLLTHLQQKHGYDEKSIDNVFMPESAVNAGANPNINQHTSNSHLASAISQPHLRHHPDIIQGWLCVTSDCGHCCYTAQTKSDHKRIVHQGKKVSTAPAVILRLLFAKSNACYFLITRVDQASSAVTTNSNKVNQHKLDYSHNQVDTHDENGDDVNQKETTDASVRKRQWKCEYPECGRSFNASNRLSEHRREHKLQIAINMQGTTFVITRQSLDDLWPCPISDCESTHGTVSAARQHIERAHSTTIKRERANDDDGDYQQQQHQTIKRKQYTIQYLNVDDFYVCGTRCGYHTTTGILICHNCRLVPECLLTYLKQKHEFDEKSIDSAVLPESARISGSDPNINQHTSNSHLASAINQLCQHHHDIVQGWLCVTSDCFSCGYPIQRKNDHKKYTHHGQHISTVPAHVLRLYYGKAHSSGYLITRLNTITNNIQSNNTMSQYNSEYDNDDGEELVLSDYSD